MRSFGDLNGVTASSLLMLRRNSIEFINSCNSSSESNNLNSMWEELRYMRSSLSRIKNVLKTKTQFNIDSDNSREIYKEKILTALAIVIKSRIDLSDAEEDDLFDDLFDDEDVSENTEVEDDLFVDEDDLFGDEEGLISNVSDFEEHKGLTVGDIKLDDKNIIEVLEKFTNEFEYIQSSMEISEGDINSILDEFQVVIDNLKMFETRCKNSEDELINQTKFMVKYMNSNSEDRLGIRPLLMKSYNRISIFNLSFNEVKNLLDNFNSLEWFETQNNSIVIDVSNYDDIVVELGDSIAYLIYKSMTEMVSDNSDLVSYLISLCEVKSDYNFKNSSILGIPLNMCHLKFKGNNFKLFCNNLETQLRVVPDKSRETYMELIRSFITSLEIIEKYAILLSTSKNDTELSEFKKFFELAYRGDAEASSYPVEMQDFFNILITKNLIPNRKELNMKYGYDLDEKIDRYSESLFDKYKLFKLASDFSIQSYSELLMKNCGYSGDISYDLIIKVNIYLKEVYKIIPLTLKEFVRDKIITTSRTKENIDKTKYSDILHNLRLLLENFKSKLFLVENNFEGDMTIS